MWALSLERSVRHLGSEGSDLGRARAVWSGARPRPHWELTTLVTKVVTRSGCNNLQGVVTRGVVTKRVVTRGLQGGL